PITAIDVTEAAIPTNRRMVDVSADDAVDTAPVRFRGERLLEFPDEVDRVLHLQLGPLRERPIGQPERLPDRVAARVEPDRKLVGLIAEKSEPTRVPNHDIEKITVDHEVALAVGRNVDRVFDHFNAAKMRAVIVTQKLVVIARDVDHVRALARLAQELLYDVVVSLRPVPAAFELPAVDDVADEVDGVGIVVAEKIDQDFGLAAFGAEVDVGQEQRPDLLLHVCRPLKHRPSRQRPSPLLGDLLAAAWASRGRSPIHETHFV